MRFSPEAKLIGSPSLGLPDSQIVKTQLPQSPWVPSLVQRLLDCCSPWALLLEDMLWFSLPSLVFPACSAFMSYPLPGCHFQPSAFRWQFITLDLRTVGLRIPFDTLPALFAFRPEVISRVPETASRLGSYRASPGPGCQFALAYPAWEVSGRRKFPS